MISVHISNESKKLKISLHACNCVFFRHFLSGRFHPSNEIMHTHSTHIHTLTHTHTHTYTHTNTYTYTYTHTHTHTHTHTCAKQTVINTYTHTSHTRIVLKIGEHLLALM